MSLYKRSPGAGTMVALAAAGVFALVLGVSSLRAEANSAASAPPPMPVTAVEAEYSGDHRIDEFYPGIVAARRESALGFDRGGRIDAIAADVGDRVERGQVLARLDTRALDAQIAAADAQTAEAAARTALAAETRDRQAQLLERGHISQQRFDEVRTSTRAAEARQNAAAAAADALRVQRDLSIVTAPFDGVVTARHADEGAIAQPGQPVLEIVEASALEIRVGLPQRIAADLRSGQSYPFMIEDRLVDAVFRASTGVVDRQTRTVTALFDLAGDARAAAGEVVRLSVATPVGTEGFWVPTSALAEGRRGLWSVYVLTPVGDGVHRLQARTVEMVRVEADRVFVRGAVDDGELVLATGVQRVTPGQRVVQAALQADVLGGTAR
ncbi:efflux RND transporter periplasmic adaptor subunit [Maricaulis sp.]|uniref:efflux RND transporter periplasmic adaptor subunit n=1 Tax=Maricaulis sp. TaxID=1486257 RepID=UPI002605C11B|nr:efflux RND transporter periplasmic adaptor subunit [Maricaulis sp.]